MLQNVMSQEVIVMTYLRKHDRVYTYTIVIYINYLFIINIHLYVMCQELGFSHRILFKALQLF